MHMGTNIYIYIYIYKNIKQNELSNIIFITRLIIGKWKPLLSTNGIMEICTNRDQYISFLLTLDLSRIVLMIFTLLDLDPRGSYHTDKSILFYSTKDNSL